MATNRLFMAMEPNTILLAKLKYMDVGMMMIEVTVKADCGSGIRKNTQLNTDI